MAAIGHHQGVPLILRINIFIVSFSSCSWASKYLLERESRRGFTNMISLRCSDAIITISGERERNALYGMSALSQARGKGREISINKIRRMPLAASSNSQHHHLEKNIASPIIFLSFALLCGIYTKRSFAEILRCLPNCNICCFDCGW